MGFKDFLIMEGGSGSGRPGYNDRPNKSLWFKNSSLWYGDIDRSWPGADLSLVDSNGNKTSISGTEDEEIADDLYAIDRDQNCYGCWKKSYKRGISFNKSRPLSTVKTKSDF